MDRELLLDLHMHLFGAGPGRYVSMSPDRRIDLELRKKYIDVGLGYDGFRSAYRREMYILQISRLPMHVWRHSSLIDVRSGTNQRFCFFSACMERRKK
jgi:hypothetical protein